jgi:hypothetical protein
VTDTAAGAEVTAITNRRASGKATATTSTEIHGENSGNAIGGLLQEVFGTDMTDAEATCATCGATGPVAATVVYLRGPGTVVRCRTCSSVLMVISRIRGMNCVDLGGLTTLGDPAPF